MRVGSSLGFAKNFALFEAIQARPQSQQGKGEGGATNYLPNKEGKRKTNKKKIQVFVEDAKKLSKDLMIACD